MNRDTIQDFLFSLLFYLIIILLIIVKVLQKLFFFEIIITFIINFENFVIFIRFRIF